MLTTGTVVARLGAVGARRGFNQTGRHERGVFVGKDVLDLLSSAMYVDPMMVYREYIQNAADSADEARLTGMLRAEERGRVVISIDSRSRTVRIRDNGCGVPYSEFWEKLTALGGSTKRGKAMRGVRGVGRLAGLAYARRLVFRSRVEGEAEVSQLTWDCLRLRAALQDVEHGASVENVIREVTIFEQVNSDDLPERFFEVEMDGVVRIRNDRLTSPAAISAYLSQVAPVAFSPEFKHGSEISRRVADHVELGEMEIMVGESEDPIFRPHRNGLCADGKTHIDFGDLVFYEIPSIDEGISAIAWVLHHDYQGAIPTGALVKGLRFRSGNIQVGGHELLEDLFPEARFNSWSVGEIHVVDRRIVPNGRRDHFEQNGHFNNLLNHLAPPAREIAKRCRTNSIRRRRERDFEIGLQGAEEAIGIIAQGSTSRRRRNDMARTTDQLLDRMQDLSQKAVLSNGLDVRNVRIEALRERLRDVMKDHAVMAPAFRRLAERRRNEYKKFFDLIYECSTNRAAAKALVDRMLRKLE